jgi:hypothetical protein
MLLKCSLTTFSRYEFSPILTIYINYSAVEHYYEIEIYIFSMKILVISVRAAVGNGGQLLSAVKFAGNSEVSYIV